MFNLSLLSIVFTLFFLPGQHLLTLDTSLSHPSSLGKIMISPALSFVSLFLGGVCSIIVIDDNHPILRHILVSTFSGLRTSSSLLLLIMLIQMLSKSRQVIELSIAVVTLKDSDASIEFWDNFLCLLTSVVFHLFSVLPD